MTAAFALTGARVPVGDALVEGWSVVVSEGRITAVLPERDVPAAVPRRHLDGGTLAAGFIDVQVNGGGGALFNDTPDVETLRTMGAAHRRFGTTGFLPTVISDDLAVIGRAMRAVERAMAEGVPGVLGIHVEGPMLAPARNGIHDRRFLRGADRAMIDLLRPLAGGRTVVTLAPEIVGADVIAGMVAAGVLVCAGHTEASHAQMVEAFDAGLSGITHLFNAMPPLVNRAPGPVGAALDNREAWCGIIVDGVHVDPAVLRIALRCRPLDRFMLVTDAMTPVGTDATAFHLQGREIRVLPDRCADSQGTLAGSNLTMARAVRNAVDLLDLPLEAALALAARSPAAFLGDGHLRGALAQGMVADMVWLDEDRHVGMTWIAGKACEEGER